MTSASNLRDSLAATWPRHRARVMGAGLASLTLGLAPFYPHAHVYKQLVNLANGTLTAPIDIFDLVFHGLPWLLLFAKLARMAVQRRQA